MLNVTRRAVSGLVLILLVSGCAHNRESLEPDEGGRTRTTLIAVGTVLLVGTVLNLAQRNTRDVLRDARPQD